MIKNNNSGRNPGIIMSRPRQDKKTNPFWAQSREQKNKAYLDFPKYFCYPWQANIWPLYYYWSHPLNSTSIFVWCDQMAIHSLILAGLICKKFVMGHLFVAKMLMGIVVFFIIMMLTALSGLVDRCLCRLGFLLGSAQRTELASHPYLCSLE